MTKALPLIDIRPDHWDIVRTILKHRVPDREVRAFGSRATWTARNYSDLDLVVLGDKPLDGLAVSLSDDFCESNLPFKVDVVDWTRIGETLRRAIQRDGVIVQPGSVLPDQQAVARMLDILDGKIELNLEMNETQEAMIHAIFQDWFVDFGPTCAMEKGQDPYLSTELWNLFPDHFAEDGEPDGWERILFGDIATITKGCPCERAERAESDVALVTLRSFQRSGGDGLEPYAGTYEPEQVIKPGELVVALSGAAQPDGIIGKIAVVNDHSRYSELVASSDVGIVRSKNERIRKSFLYCLMQSHEFQNHVLSRCTETLISHLGREDVLSVGVCVPDESVLMKFDQLVEPIMRKIMANFTECVLLTRFRDVFAES